MKVFQVGKTQIVFGATWTTLPGVSAQRKEIRVTTKNNDMNFYCGIERASSRPIIGMASDLQGKTYAGAALIAHLLPDLKNAVVVVPLQPGITAAICYADGLPMPGFDYAGSTKGACAAVEKFMLIMGAAAGVVLYGDFSEFDIDFGSVIPFSIDDEKFDSGQLAGAQFKSIGVNSTVVFSVLGVLFVLGIAGYFYYEMTQAEARRRKPVQIDPNVAYEASVKIALASAGTPAHKTMPVMMQTIASLPLYVGGWKASRIFCSLESCAMDWLSDKQLGSTFKEFQLSLPTGWSAAYKSDFDSISTAAPNGIKIEPGVKPADAQAGEAFVIEMGSELQRLKLIGIDLKFQPPVIFGLPPQVGGQLSVTESLLSRPIKEGTWSISGPWWITDFVHKLPPNMTMSTVELRNGEAEISLTIEGKYYVTK